MRKIIFMALVLVGSIGSAFAQCTTVTAVYGPGVPPCLEEPVSVYTAFEVWPTEAYAFDGVEAGVSYEFSLTGGAAGAWDAEFTVYAPSGAIDAFGGAANAISFTATESGQYLFGFFDTALGCGVETQVNNGFATLTYLSGPISTCAPPVTECEAGNLVDDTPVTLPSTTATTDVDATGVIIPNSPTTGGQGVLFQPQAGAGGGLGGEFILSGVTLPYVFDADLNGVLSTNGFPLMTGLYNVRPAVFADNANIFASICDTTFRARPVTFPEGGAVVCDAGTLTSPDQFLCPGDIWNLEATGDSIPLGGDYAWFFFNVDTTQADYGYFLGNPYVGDLNALLATIGDTIQPGTYEVVGAAYTVDSLCSIAEGAFFVTVYDESDPACSGCQVPSDLDVVEIGFGTANARVNATWTNPEGTTNCEVRGGRISPASYDAGEPEFANQNNTQTITQTDGTTVLFNVVLYNNPNVPFVEGQRYGYEVRCECSDGSGFSEWANITPEATFVVPFAPPGMNPYEGTKVTTAMVKSLANLKAADNQNVRLVAAPRTVRKAELPNLRPTASVKSLEAAQMNLFPNPTENVLNISVESTAASNLDVMVFDMTGRVVITEQMSVVKGMNLLNVDVQNLEYGMYILSIGDVKQTFVKK